MLSLKSTCSTSDRSDTIDTIATIAQSECSISLLATIASALSFIVAKQDLCEITRQRDRTLRILLANVSLEIRHVTRYVAAACSFVTKMAHHIRVKAVDRPSTSSPGSTGSWAAADAADDDDEEETLLAELCPQFVWSVRDFTLRLDLDGKPATPDEYLERCLHEKPGIQISIYRPGYRQLMLSIAVAR